MTAPAPGLAVLQAAAARHHLAVMGAFHPTPEDGAPEGCATLLLLGPAEPGFWAHITAQPEWPADPNPIDAWSRRVIGGLAAQFDATALFPFGGPPWQPFFRWALRSGRAWASPVTLLVQDRMGLFASYRGALALRARLDLPPPPERSPCDTCAGQPCRSACPAGALTPAGYDVPACRAFLDTDAGRDCLSQGCAVRRACPLSQSYGRLAEQSAYHMRRFHT